MVLDLILPSLKAALYWSVVLYPQRPKCFHINVTSMKREKINITNCNLSLLFHLNKNSDTLSISQCHQGNFHFALFCFVVYMQNTEGEPIFQRIRKTFYILKDKRLILGAPGWPTEARDSSSRSREFEPHTGHRNY